MARLSSSMGKRLLAAAGALALALVLAACGGGGDTTTTVQASTVTTQEGEAAAAGTTTTPEGTVITGSTSQSGSSDAASVVPGDQSTVAGAQPEVAASSASTTSSATTTVQGQTTTPSQPTGGVNGVIGQGPQTTTTAAAPVTTTTTNPDTGEVTTTTVPQTSGGTTVTTTDPNTGQVITTTVPQTNLTTTVPLGRANRLPGGDDEVLTRPFSADSPWNTPVQHTKTDPQSRRWMRLARVRVANSAIVKSRNLKTACSSTTRPSSGARKLARKAGIDVQGHRSSPNCRVIRTGLTINTTRWTLPVFSNTQQGAVRRVAICRQFDCGPDAVTSVVIPPDACPQPQYDGWMTVIDNTTHSAYDFWRARCEADGSISYQYVTKWDLDGPGFQQPDQPSARGSGLPLFAGLITPQEVRSGQINHALAISVPGAATRRYVQPASRTDGTGFVDSLPEGARIRLKPGSEKLITHQFARNKTERRTARTIIKALERYGAIVVDRSAAATLYAQKNANWAGILPLNLLQEIGLDRFEAIKAGKVFFDPPRNQQTFAPGVVGSVPSTGSGSQGAIEFGSPSVGLAP